MKLRIKELESQCWEARNYGPPWFDSEKFAELIAKECANIAMQLHFSASPEDYDSLDAYERGTDDAASTISGRIRMTFGVKE